MELLPVFVRHTCRPCLALGLSLFFLSWGQKEQFVAFKLSLRAGCSWLFAFFSLSRSPHLSLCLILSSQHTVVKWLEEVHTLCLIKLFIKR